MLPLRIKVGREERFGAVAKKTRDAVLNALVNSALFDAILNHLNISRSTTTHPLFQVALTHQNGAS